MQPTCCARACPPARDSDIACRYGGADFCMILRDTTRGGGVVLVERIREEVAALAFKAGTETVSITVSIGGVSESDIVDGQGDLTGC